MSEPSWTEGVADWPPGLGESPRQFCLLEREAGTGWRLVLYQRVNSRGDRAHRHYMRPFAWRAPGEPVHNMLLQKRGPGSWALSSTLGRWWTPMWLEPDGVR